MKILKSLLLAGALARTATASPTLEVRALEEFPKAKQEVVRLNGFSALPGNAHVTGFCDFYGKTSDNFYSEVSVGKSFGNVGARLEWNGGSRMTDLFRIGAYSNPRIHKNLFLVLNAFPLTVGTDKKIRKIGQVSAFGKLNLPKGFSIENWTDFNLDYNTFKTFIQSEISIDKTIVGNLSAEVQAVYNVAVPRGLDARAGLHYNF